MNETRATALVLRSVDYADSDRIVTFFTREHGKIAAFARSARKSQKRFGGSLEPFHRVKIRYREKRGDLSSLAGAEIDRARPGISGDWDLIARASYLVELVTEATRDRESHPELFDHLDGALEALAAPGFAGATKARRDGWLAAFELKLLALAGYRPVLEACVECGTVDAERYRFSPDRGTVMCFDCSRDGIAVSAGTLKLLEASLESDLPHVERLAFSEQQSAEARRLLGAFLRWQLGKELRSARFLDPL